MDVLGALRSGAKAAGGEQGGCLFLGLSLGEQGSAPCTMDGCRRRTDWEREVTTGSWGSLRFICPKPDYLWAKDDPNKLLG